MHSAVLSNSVLLKAYLEGISVNDTMIPLSSESAEIHVNTLQIGSAPKMPTNEWLLSSGKTLKLALFTDLLGVIGTYSAN